MKLEERKRKILLQKQRMKEQQARKAALKKGKQLGGAGGVVSGPPGIVVSAPTPSLGQVRFSVGSVFVVRIVMLVTVPTAGAVLGDQKLPTLLHIVCLYLFVEGSMRVLSTRINFS